MACRQLPWTARPGTGCSGLDVARRCVLLVALALILPPGLPWAGGQFADHDGQRGRFQDYRALQRLSMGMYFYREGVLNPRTARVSKTFVVPRPSLQDLLPEALVSLASLKDAAGANAKASCRTSEKVLLKILMKNFKTMNLAIDDFPERPNSSLTSSRDVRLPPWRYDPFPRRFLDAGPRPGYLSMEQDLFIPSEEIFQTRYLALNNKVRVLQDFSQDVTMNSLSLMGLRNHSESIVLQMVDGLDRYVLRHHALVLDAFQVASLAREFTVAVKLLQDDVISPDLIPKVQQVQMQDEVSAMLGGSPGDMDFTSSVDSVSRDEANVYITVSVAGGSRKDLMDVYSVHTPTLYLDVEEGKGSTKLVDVAPYFAVSRDGSYFIEMSREQYRDCVGDRSRHCQHIFVTGPASSQRSCLWALFTLDKATMRERCFYEARHSTPPTSAFEYDKGWVFLTNVSNVTFIHMNGTKVGIPACPNSQCVAFIPCHYRTQADHYLFPARHSDCIERDPVMRVFFPINLAVVYQTEKKLFVYFLIPPDAIETSNMPVPHSSIENLRTRPTFTIVEDVVAKGAMRGFHQGPVPNATDPHGKSAYESPADKAMIAVFCLTLIPMLYLTWRQMRRNQELLERSYHNVVFSAGDVLLDEAGGGVLSGIGQDTPPERPNPHVYMRLADDRPGRRGEEMGARGPQPREETLQYQLEKEADEIYKTTRENYLNAQRQKRKARRERKAKEQNVGTPDQNVESQDEYLHPTHQTYSQGGSRRTRRQGRDTHAQNSGQDDQAQRRHDAADESQSSIYMTITLDQDQSAPSHDYASCDAATTLKSP